MHILGTLGRGLLLLIIPLLLGVWVFLATANFTVLDRQVVFGWLKGSGAYNGIVSTVVRPQSQDQQQFLDSEVLTQAIGKALPSDYIAGNIETVLNSAYDWLEGKTNEIAFSIDLSDRRAELEKQLAAVVATKFDGLPECTTQVEGLGGQGDNPTCLPKGFSPAQAADDLARRSVESTDFLSQPITQNLFSDAKLPDLTVVRSVYQLIPILLIALPVLILVFCGLYVLISPDKLRGLQTIGRQIAITMFLPAALGATMWIMGPNLSLDSFGDPAIIDNIVEPIAHQILAGVGLWLLIFSGSALALGAAAWIVAFVLLARKHKQPKLDTPAYQPPVNPAQGDKPAAPPAQNSQPNKPDNKITL